MLQHDDFLTIRNTDIHRIALAPPTPTPGARSQLSPPYAPPRIRLSASTEVLPPSSGHAEPSAWLSLAGGSLIVTLCLLASLVIPPSLRWLPLLLLPRRSSPSH